MTHDQLIDAEQGAHKAFRAARIFADGDRAGLQAQLNRAEFILAEVRHAGHTLCDAEANEEQRCQAFNRLAGLFTRF